MIGVVVDCAVGQELPGVAVPPGVPGAVVPGVVVAGVVVAGVVVVGVVVAAVVAGAVVAPAGHDASKLSSKQNVPQ